MEHKEVMSQSEYLYRGKILNLRKDGVVLPNGREAIREVVEHAGAVAVVPVTNEGNIIIVKQFRYVLGQAIMELPAGNMDEGETSLQAAQRELQEEIGFAAKEMKFLFSSYTSPGFTDEIIHFYIARDLYESSIPCDDDEFIEVFEVSPDQALEMILTGEIIDGKTISGILAFLREKA